MRTQNQGFTLIEMLIALATVGILMVIGIGQLRPPEARLFANGLKAQIVQARLEAIKRNRPVAVLWNSTAKSFTTLVKSDEDSTALPCSATDQMLLRRLVSEYPRVEATNVFTSSVSGTAVVWYPSGLPRFCNGAVLPTTNSSIKVSDSRRTLYVRIAPAGRVEVANAP